MRKIIIGTRGSVLAKAQAVYVKKRLEENYPEFNFEIKEIVTTGDKDLKSNWENSDKSLKAVFLLKKLKMNYCLAILILQFIQ